MILSLAGVFGNTIFSARILSPAQTLRNFGRSKGGAAGQEKLVNVMAKFSALIDPRLLRPDDAARYVGGEGILRLFVAAGWLVPVVRRKRLTLYRRADLDACCSRLEAGEFPEVEKAKARSENAFSIP